jgi:RNA polymerase sigma-54 factor
VRFETSQKLRTGQSLRLAPRMIQSMEVLQMPLAQLQERVEQELERNVALEQVEPQSGDAPPVSSEDPPEDEPVERPLTVGERGEDFERARAFERELEDSPWHRPSRRGDDDGSAKMEMLAGTPARRERLGEQLKRQWEMAEVPERVLAAGRLLVDFIDDDGLLSADLATIALQGGSVEGGPFTEAELAAALPQVQLWLEPAGVAARDIRESLQLQLESRLDPHRWSEPPSAADREAIGDAITMVRDHYEDLLENRLPRIAQRSGLSLERVEAAKERLRRLTTSPGRDLVDDEPAIVIPDAMVEYDAEGDRYVAALCDGPVPPLRVSPTYAAMAERPGVDPATRGFLQEGMRAATWLIDAITQRRTTLLRVVEVVLERQRDWFDQGPGHLRPLPMADVAEVLGVHVATVSRAVSGKWLQTPRGLVELRRFFTGGTETEDGTSVSWEAVRTMLQEEVEAEDKAHPLSDEALAARLKSRGVTIARRTVVKYREQMGIPPARRRRRHGGGAAG